MSLTEWTSSERIHPNKIVFWMTEMSETAELSCSECIQNNPPIQHAAGAIVAMYNPVGPGNALPL